MLIISQIRFVRKRNRKISYEQQIQWTQNNAEDRNQNWTIVNEIVREFRARRIGSWPFSGKDTSVKELIEEWHWRLEEEDENQMCVLYFFFSFCPFNIKVGTISLGRSTRMMWAYGSPSGGIAELIRSIMKKFFRFLPSQSITENLSPLI